MVAVRGEVQHGGHCKKEIMWMYGKGFLASVGEEELGMEWLGSKPTKSCSLTRWSETNGLAL